MKRLARSFLPGTSNIRGAPKEAHYWATLVRHSSNRDAILIAVLLDLRPLESLSHGIIIGLGSVHRKHVNLSGLSRSHVHSKYCTGARRLDEHPLLLSDRHTTTMLHVWIVCSTHTNLTIVILPSPKPPPHSSYSTYKPRYATDSEGASNLAPAASAPWEATHVLGVEAGK